MRSSLAPFVIAAAVGLAAPRVALADGPAGNGAGTPRASGERRTAPAQRPRATVLPAVLEDGPRRRPAAGETEQSALLAKVDELLADTARDLGLTTEGPRALLPDPTTVTDQEMLDLARATGGAVIAATVRVSGGDVDLRVSLATSSRRTLTTRTERFPKDDLAVRAVVTLRDVVTDAGLVTRKSASAGTTSAAPAQMAVGVRSEGRAVLAANATVFGGMMGFSVERSSGSDDPRLLYPLLAVGAGVGLGASLLIADEWDVGAGDAWFLSSGGIWPTAAAHLIYEGRFGGASGHAGPEGDRWAFGLVGGTAGLTLATLSLSLGDMESGGAVLAHSGGALGLGFGALTEWFARGSTRDTPFAGMGYGAAIGWLAAAGAATTRVHLSPMRVLSIDLGAVLGGLGGAALASPLVFDGPSSSDTRGWVAAIGGGALIGAGAALWITRRDKAPGGGSAAAEALPAVRVAQGVTLRPDLPEIGLLGEAPLDPSAAPAFGARLRGRW